MLRKDPKDIKQKELYYDKLTDQVYFFRGLLREIKADALTIYKNNFDKNKYQKKVIQDVKSVLTEKDIDLFKFYFDHLTTLRGDVLKGFAKKIVEHAQAETGIKPVYNIEIRAKSGNRGPIYKKKVHMDDKFLPESDINDELSSKPKLYLPEELLNKKNIEILSTKNLVEFYPSLILQDQTPKYTLIFRIKSGPREKEKIVDWILEVNREEFHYDGIGTTSVVPSNKFYDQAKLIKSLSDTNMSFKSEYRPTEEKNKYPDISHLFENWNENNMQKVIVQGDTIANYIKARKKGTFTDDDWKYFKKVLLAGAWIDHYFKNMRIESIVQTQKFFDWSEGPIGRDSDADIEGLYDDRRIAKRKYEHMNRKEGNIIAPSYSIAKYLDKRFDPVFPFRIRL